MSIQLINVSHVYSAGSVFQHKALDQVNLNIQDGEFIALVGHTGCGKSTLVQHLNGLLKPTSGQVLIDGQDIHQEQINRKQLCQRVGLVFQYPEYQLFEETVEKDIAFGPKNMGLPENKIHDRVIQAMSMVHLNPETIASKNPFELSGGQMRRVAIAGVLAMQPQTLVLDEPAAGLDPKGRDQILSIIREMHDQGKTILMVSHSMDDIADLATRIVVMQDGTILAEGSPRDIFSQEDIIQQAGLSVPEAAQLCRKLRAHGLDIPANLYTHSEVRDAIIRLWKEQNHAQ